MGAVPPRAPHTYVYGACAAHASRNGPFQGVLRVHMVTGEEVAHFPGPRMYTNEYAGSARTIGWHGAWERNV